MFASFPFTILYRAASELSFLIIMMLTIIVEGVLQSTAKTKDKKKEAACNRTTE